MEEQMTISPELETEIARLIAVEDWPVGTVASQLKVHRDVVTRIAMELSGVVKDPTSRGPRLVEPYVDFLRETLREFPGIPGSRLFNMAKKRGYPGRSTGHFRRTVRTLRGPKPQEAFLRLHTLPGEESQIDWADFGAVEVRGGTRRLYGFLMTLSWSRAHYLRFFWLSQMLEFQRGFIEGMDFFDGMTQRGLMDNLKSGVTERVGTIIRFNERFLDFAKHYRFLPRAARPRRGNEKGRVERGVRFVRENFFAGRKWRDLDDLNEQALEWCLNESLDRLWRRGDKRLVRDALEEERKYLLPLPASHYPSADTVFVEVGKTPYVRFDTNDYSVPHLYVGRRLQVIADEKILRVVDEAQKLIAEHPRSYDKHQTYENQDHLRELKEQKKMAVAHSGLARLTNVVDSAERFVTALAERGQHLGGAVSSLLKMLDLHGSDRLERALQEVLKAGSINLRSVHLVLRQIEVESEFTEPKSIIIVPEKVANLTVKHHDLSRYDSRGTET
jgi:transposase